MTALWLLFAALLIGGPWLALRYMRAQYRLAQPTFDEHVATTPGMRRTDQPDARPLSFIEQVEAYVAAHAPKES